jgi:hypothetical protein
MAFSGLGRRIERSIQLVDLFRAIIVPLSPRTWPTLEMLLEVADSSMTYRSRYFTVLQAAPVLDLLMNDEANPRSLAFQIHDLLEHCRCLSGGLPGLAWPVSKQRHLEEAAANLFRADVRMLCQPGEGEASASRWTNCWPGRARRCPLCRMPSPMSISVTRKWSGPLDLSRPAQNHLRL